MNIHSRIIKFLKLHPSILFTIWRIAKYFFNIIGWFVPVRPKTMIFCCLGGRKYDDSPKAIYEEICNRSEFRDWHLVWAFIDPNNYTIPRGEKIKIDTLNYFITLLRSKVWICNSGIDRGIGLKRKKSIRVETWHGLPFKKIGGEENQNSIGRKPEKNKGKLNKDIIRCAQSEYDQEIYSRIYHADKSSIILCDLPRNDSLLNYTSDKVESIKKELGLDLKKKIILYAPTYREYLLNENNDTYLAPPIHLERWEKELGEEYILLIRAHYAVTESLNLNENSFVRDVSRYPFINDLYAITDLLISDYSSVFVDYSILDRPMLCFAYDLEEYEQKRGLYVKLDEIMPCEIDYTEETLLDHIKELDYSASVEKTKEFHKRFAPYAGNASKTIVDIILSRL